MPVQAGPAGLRRHGAQVLSAEGGEHHESSLPAGALTPRQSSVPSSELTGAASFAGICVLYRIQACVCNKRSIFQALKQRL